MKHKSFIATVNLTENKDYEGMANRLQSHEVVRLLHAAIGLSTEANEILDTLKKHIFYGKELDKLNLKEELGDLYFYGALLHDQLDISLEEVMQSNARKLRVRYGDKFSKDAALNRSIDEELEAVANEGK